MAITYNPTTDKRNLLQLFTTTGGGTVFSANLTASTAFDLFSDTAVANDAIYFGIDKSFSDLYFDIGTAMAGTDIVLIWEYYAGSPPSTLRNFLPVPGDWTSAKWQPIEDLQDDTNGFTVTGANTVKFPVQMFMQNVAVNGSTNLYVRCRIVSLTAITEGGANQTTRVQTNWGRVYIKDYTESVPCTFSEVSAWLLANQPHLSSTRFGSSFFDFKKTPLRIDSPLTTINETVEIGNWVVTGCEKSAGTYLYYIRSGTKIGDRAGIDGSTFILYSQSNDTIAWFNANSKCYGTRFVSRLGASNPSGYPTPAGEFIDCNIEFNAYPSVSLIGYNNKWVNYGTYIMQSFWNPATFLGNKFILNSNNLGLIYQSGWDAKEATWAYKSTVAGRLFQKYQTSSIQTYNFYDCTPLPELGKTPDLGSPTLIQFDGSTIREIDYRGKMFFYDSTAGTFTEYTAAVKTGGAGNVPINGEVGDYLCWYAQTSTFDEGYEYLLTVPEGQTSNDYEYVWEYYGGGAWRAFNGATPFQSQRIIDRTNNFTKSDNILLMNGHYNNKVTTLNSISAAWIRLRITKKGTGSPVITTMRHYWGAAWCNDWNYKEWYSAVYKIVEQDGTPIEGATVVIKDKDGTVALTKTTDSSGLTASDYILTTHAYFDDDADLSVAPAYWGRGKQIGYSPFEIYITKTGYETYYIKKDITEKINETIPLKKATPILFDTEGKLYQKLNDTNLGAFRDMIDGEVY